jgi:hypothetical protein
MKCSFGDVQTVTERDRCSSGRRGSMSRVHSRLLISGLLVAALLSMNLEAGMAFDRTIMFFSEVNGRLIDADGSPHGGIRIERSWRRSPDDDPVIDETITGPDGAFFFPAATGPRSMVGRLPGTPVIRQEITAFGPDGPVTLWKAVKTNLEPNGELDGRPLNLECRIGVEPDGEGPVWGTCRESAVPIPSPPVSGSSGHTLTWQWPAGRPVDLRLLVRIERVERVRRGLLARIENSPSLAGSIPDPHEIGGTVLHGPQALSGRHVRLRVPGAETSGLIVGRIASLGIVEDEGVCICVSPGTDGCNTEPPELP